RRIGVVFQDFRLFDHLSAFDNVALPLKLAGRKEGQYAQDVQELLSWVGLGDRMAAPPTRFPAASSSAWPSRAPSSPAPTSWWPTNPPAMSTPKWVRASFASSPN